VTDRVATPVETDDQRGGREAERTQPLIGASHDVLRDARPVRGGGCSRAAR